MCVCISMCIYVYIYMYIHRANPTRRCLWLLTLDGYIHISNARRSNPQPIRVSFFVSVQP